MDGLSFSVEGNRVILDNLDALETEIRVKLDAALEASATVGLQHAESVVPVDTGFLRSRLDVEVRDGQVILSDDAPYAAFVELGTVKMSPQPFLVPGAIAAGEELKQQLEGIV